jgi:hypothetical protein
MRRAEQHKYNVQGPSNGETGDQVAVMGDGAEQLG